MSNLPAPDPVLELSADDAAVLERELGHAAMAIATLREGIASGRMEQGFARNVLYVLESTLAEACRVTGISTDTAAERDERYAMLRAANLRVRELEQQLGQSVGAVALKQGVKAYADAIKAWWDEDGFGYVSEVQFGAYGSCQLTLSTGLRGKCSFSWSKTPVSDEEARRNWVQELEAAGFELTFEDGRDDGEVLDTPASREALLALIAAALPSATVTRIESRALRSGQFVLSYIHAHVQELSDIEVLVRRFASSG